VLLIIVAIAALVAANSPFAAQYFELFHAPLPWSPVPKLDTLHLWINDALMAVFFFVVGLEVKREVVAGQLASPRQRRLPVLAAIAGMAAPALAYLLVAGGDPQLHRGWAIPAATDIAFAMGIVGLLGSRVPPALRLFLLTLAVVDDIGAVAIIAAVYTVGLAPIWLLAGLVVVVGLLALNRAGVQRAWPYLLGSVALWFCVLYSGAHATVAGVVAALTIPMGLLDRLEHRLAGWNSYLVVPLFGFANAGVSLSALGWGGILAPLPVAIGAGLALGKQLGIFTTIAVAHRTGFALKPVGASWVQIWGISVLAGIGFTMSLFIAGLAFPLDPELVEQSKIGVLGGSLVSAVLGYGILRFASR
jgi:NhaA family Na+:H+ antiporter